MKNSTRLSKDDRKKTQLYKSKKEKYIVSVFNEDMLLHKKCMQYLAYVIHMYANRDASAIILCGAYKGSCKKIMHIAQSALLGKEKNAFVALETLCTMHVNICKELLSLKEKTPSSNKKEALPYIHVTEKYARTIINSAEKSITKIKSDIYALIMGITRIKEISQRTKQLLLDSMVLLSTEVISVYIKAIIHLFNLPYTKIHSYKNIESIPSRSVLNKHSSSHKKLIVSSLLSNNEIKTHGDFAIIKCVKKIKAEHLDIWTHTRGVMTADIRHVPSAQPVKYLSYNDALEIAYLGGKILHPTALQMLMEMNIPIYIFSIEQYSQYATCISTSHNLSSLQKRKRNCLLITNRDKFSIITIRSAKMFDIYGYLEEISKVCTHYKIPIETLATSEISITMTCKTDHCTRNFILALQKLGTVECTHGHSIISVIGIYKWENPHVIADILRSIHKNIILDMLSLGKSANNLSFVCKNIYAPQVLQQLHKKLFE